MKTNKTVSFALGRKTSCGLLDGTVSVSVFCSYWPRLQFCCGKGDKGTVAPADKIRNSATINLIVLGTILVGNRLIECGHSADPSGQIEMRCNQWTELTSIHHDVE